MLKKNKTAIIITTVIIVWLTVNIGYFLLRFGGSNIYRIVKHNYNEKDYQESEKLIDNFSDIIKEPLDIPKEENGMYWFTLAGLGNVRSEFKPKYNASNILENVTKKYYGDVHYKYDVKTQKGGLINKEAITFKDHDIVSAVEKFAPIEELIEKGNACKYFERDYQGKKNPFGSPNFLAIRKVSQFYALKAICEINDKQYDKAADTINESLKFIISSGRNYGLSDRKVLIECMIEIALLNFAGDSLEYLLEKSDKPYPELLQTFKQVKNNFSDGEIKRTFATDLMFNLATLDQKTEIKNYELGLENSSYLRIKAADYIFPTSLLAKIIMSRCSKIHSLNNYKFAVKYIDTKDLEILEQMDRYNKVPDYQVYDYFSVATPNYRKAIENIEICQKKLTYLEDKLEKKGASQSR